MTDDEAIAKQMAYDFGWFLRRLRRLVPSPRDLERRYMAVYEAHKDIICQKSGKPAVYVEQLHVFEGQFHINHDKCDLVWALQSSSTGRKTWSEVVNNHVYIFWEKQCSSKNGYLSKLWHLMSRLQYQSMLYCQLERLECRRDACRRWWAIESTLNTTLPQ